MGRRFHRQVKGHSLKDRIIQLESFRIDDVAKNEYKVCNKESTERLHCKIAESRLERCH